MFNNNSDNNTISRAFYRSVRAGVPPPDRYANRFCRGVSARPSLAHGTRPTAAAAAATAVAGTAVEGCAHSARSDPIDKPDKRPLGCVLENIAVVLPHTRARARAPLAETPPAVSRLGLVAAVKKTTGPVGIFIVYRRFRPTNQFPYRGRTDADRTKTPSFVQNETSTRIQYRGHTEICILYFFFFIYKNEYLFVFFFLSIC